VTGMATSTAKRGTRYVASVPPEEILPVSNGRYESTVKGIYVIGDVTGLPLVKVAANHGVDVIAGMRQSGDLPGAPPADGVHDVLIIGAGPAGVSAAVEASRIGVKALVLERGVLSNTVHSFPTGKRVYAEPRFLQDRSEIPTEGDPVRDDFLASVRDVVETHDLEILEGVEVTAVHKEAGGTFVAETRDGQTYAAGKIIVAIGRQGQPRQLGVPGEDRADKVTHRFHTPEDYRDKDVLVVGGGNSAVEAALMLAETSRVTVSYRRDAFFRLKRNNLDAITQAAAAGRLEILFESKVTDIRDGEVDLEIDGETRTLPNNSVVVLAGSLPAIGFLMDMGLELDGIWTQKRVLWSFVGILIGCLIYFGAKHIYLLPERAAPGQLVLPGFQWLFSIIPPYFANLYGLYYLLYFSAIAGFGLFWAARYRHRIVWRRNLLIILFNWTVWWGLPTFLVALGGRNIWTSILPKLLNAWPLNMGAYSVAPVVQVGDPIWWHTVAVLGVVWAVLLTFVILPLFTVLVGKHYCSHLCSCGALAETVGNSFRHRAPKADLPRWLERFGFVFIALAAVATIADLLGRGLPLRLYNVWVGTLLAGALAIGLYPFLGQRVWCRYWCPLAFWMNFWGRWSRFKISPEPGKCIDCNVCNRYCQMGIDIKSRALRGIPVTLQDTPCVACGECIVRCPMEILHFGELPEQKPYPEGTDAGSGHTVKMRLDNDKDYARMNELSMRDRDHKGDG
jgi:thioredoxin reductase/NAD-dependent dihydropyrimidine dehydrogenase PreA subunit